MTYRRWQIASAIVSFCSMIRIAIPRAAIFSNNSRTSTTICGASPSVGSSTISRFGSPISERQIVSICCSPPDNTPPGASARSRSNGNEIGSLHRSVSSNALGRVRRNDFAVHEHRNPVGQIEDDAHVVLHNDERAILRYGADQRDGVGRFVATHARGGFVEQNDGR